MNNRDMSWCEVAFFILFLLAIFAFLASCATYQVMDMKRVPRHPRPDSAAIFPMIPPPSR